MHMTITLNNMTTKGEEPVTAMLLESNDMMQKPSFTEISTTNSLSTTNMNVNLANLIVASAPTEIESMTKQNSNLTSLSIESTDDFDDVSDSTDEFYFPN